jgi:tape measure domain-containing protein
MSGNLDDLDFGLSVAYEDSLRGLRQVASELDRVQVSVTNLVPSYATLNGVASQLASTSTLPTKLVTTLDSVAAGAEIVETSMISAAFSADLVAASLSKASTIATAAGAAFGVLDKSASSATSGLTSIGGAAGSAAPVLQRLSTVTQQSAFSMRAIASGARVVGGTVGALSSAVRSASAGMLHLVHSIHAAQIFADLLASAFAVLMVPIRIIGAAASLAFRAMTVALNTVLLPVKWLFSGLMAVAGAMKALFSAATSVAITVFKVWFVFKGFIGTIKVMTQWLGMLPPKLRILVGGLLALGATGKVGAFAMRGIATGVKIATTAFQALSLPVIAITNPMRALRTAAMLTGQAVMFAGKMAGQAASGFATLARSAGNAAVSVASSIGGRLAGAVNLGVNAIGLIGAASVAMAATTAMAVEKNQAVFGVMLKDMEQGKAVVASLQEAKSVGLFDNEEVLNSGRLLFKAGVAAADLAGKTDQLATIAAATSTELSGLTRIYQQGANRGSFGQDKINQMAERGIDIYHALEAVTGKSGAALSDMISGGKIGITEMDAALAHLTTGNGIYAGSLETLGGTTSGMLAQIKNNLVQALGGIGGVGLEAFRPILAGVLTLSEGIKTSIGAVAPIVTQLFQTIKAAFTGIWSVVSATFTGIFGAGAATFGGLLSVTMEWVTKFRFFFENIIPIVQFVGLSMTSVMVTAFNDIAYFITDTIPAYLTWFGENWANVFSDIASGTATIFTNLAANIGNAMRAIWNFIKSGGTADLELAWTPLLTGFQSTVAALPDVPERALTALEESLQQQTQQIGTELADSFDALNMEAQATLTLTPPVMPEIDPTLQSGGMTDGQGESAGNRRTNFAVSGLERGSEAALNAIFNASKDKVPSQQLAEQKKTNGHLAKIANKPQPVTLGGV